jgi:hypothetical protein
MDDSKAFNLVSVEDYLEGKKLADKNSLLKYI